MIGKELKLNYVNGVPEPITCQGIFRWVGQEYKRIKGKINYMDITRERKIFVALNIPGVSSLTDKELADQIIIDLKLDEGLQSPYLITDPQRVNGAFMQPATEQEVTDNPGQAIIIVWMDIPRYARFTDPEETHNFTVKAAFRDMDYPNERTFDAAHGAFVQTYEYQIVDNRRSD